MSIDTENKDRSVVESSGHTGGNDGFLGDFSGAIKPHWYKQIMFECPVCGRGSVYRERVYGEKPSDPAKWYEYHDDYDWCLEYGA